MHYFEEEFKNRFKNAGSQKGVDADQLWNAIADELSAEEAPVPKAWKRRHLLFLLLSLTLFTSAVFYFFAQKTPTITIGNTATEAVVAEEASQPTTSNTIVDATGHSQQDNGQAVPAASDSLTRAGIVHIATQFSPIVNLNEVLKGGEESKRQLLPEAGKIDKKLSPEENTFSNQTHRPVALDGGESINGLNTPESVHQQAVFHAVAPLGATSKFVSQGNPQEAVLPIQVMMEGGTFVKQEKRTSQTGIFAGVARWQDIYQKDGAPQGFQQKLTDAHKAVGGYSFSLEKQWSLSKKLHFTAGATYAQLLTEFNNTQMWDTVMYRDNIPGPDLINASATRRVRHQNSFRQIAIPLLLGTQTQREGLRFGLNAGLGLHYLLAQKGKSLNQEEEIFAYGPSTSSPLPYSRFFLSFQLQPYLAFQANHHLSLQLRPHFNYQIHGQSEAYGRKHASLVSGLSIGIVLSK